MSPFDEARYERLLKGLEVAERRLSELERTGRIDAEFFRHRHLEIERKLAAARCESVASVALVSDGNHFSISESFVDEGVPYYRGQDAVGHFFIEQASPNKITRAAFEQPYMRRSHLTQGDVLLSIIGTVGETSLVKTKQDATCSCKLAILRPSAIEPAYLATYLSSAIGRLLTERWKRGAVQTGLLLEDMDQLPVPRFGNGLEERIAHVVELAYESLETSKRNSELAETTLLHALGLDTWQAPEPLSYVRSSRDAFAAGRLDAEHFQPKFDSLLDHIEATGQSCPLANLLTVNQRGTQPDYGESGLPVVNSKHVNKGEVRIDADNRFAIVDEKILLIEPGDVLINGTGVGTIGRAAPYLHKSKSVPDNHVTVLRPADGIDPVYLSVFLNSMAGQLQVAQRLHGSSGQIELYPNDIAQFVIWRAPAAVQTEIRAAVQRSFEKKQHSIQILDAAKRAVEMAIEESEAAALDYLADVVCEEGPNDEV